MKHCAALAVLVNAQLPAIAMARDVIAGTDRPEERAAVAQVVRDARRLHASLRRFKPFPTRRLIIDPAPDAELDAALARLLAIIGGRQTLAARGTRLWLACASTLTPWIVQTLRAAGWRGPLSTNSDTGPVTGVLCKLIEAATGEEPDQASLAHTLRLAAPRTRKETR